MIRLLKLTIVSLLLLLCVESQSLNGKTREFFSGKTEDVWRSVSIPRTRCVGLFCDEEVSQSIQCRTAENNSVNYEWQCEAMDMPKGYDFDKIAVDCEGYSSPHDPLVLEGSCDVIYSLKKVPIITQRTYHKKPYTKETETIATQTHPYCSDYVGPTPHRTAYVQTTLNHNDRNDRNANSKFSTIFKLSQITFNFFVLMAIMLVFLGANLVIWFLFSWLIDCLFTCFNYVTKYCCNRTSGN